MIHIIKFAWKIYFLMPPKMRYYVKLFLKGGFGHKASLFNSQIANRDARGKCRIDNASEIFCNYLDAAGISSLEDMNCLEIGTGYVGTNAIIMWLLGAKLVVTIDINKILAPLALKSAVVSVESALLFSKLKGNVKSEEELKVRVDSLYAWAKTDSVDHSEFFIYLSPFDLLINKFPQKFNFLTSVSTLEHIPKSITDQFLKKMAEALENSGVGLHFVDLTDHLDHHGDPLGFLSKDVDNYSDDSDADSRGNRIRASEWVKMFSESGMVADIVMSTSASHRLLPENLSRPFDEMNKEDLLVTSILIRSSHSSERSGLGNSDRFITER